MLTGARQSVPLKGTNEDRPHSGKTRVSETGGAESGAVGAENAPIDPDLQTIIKRWPSLPEAVKADILAMVQPSGK